MLLPARQGLAGLLAQLVQRLLQPGAVLGHRVHHRQRDRLEPLAGRRAVQRPQLLQLLVEQHRRAQLDLPGRLGLGVEQVALGTDGGLDRHDDLFPDGVHRRVGHLREQLLEVVEQRLRPVRQHRQRRVGAHRPDRLGAGLGHGLDQLAQVLGGVAEGLLADLQGLVVGLDGRGPGGQIAGADHVVLHPAGVGVLAGVAALDLLVRDDALLGGVDQEHAPRLDAALGGHLLGRDVRQHARLGRHHHQAVLGDVVAQRAQAVAVQHRADLHAVGEADGRRAVPRLHQAGVVLVERLALGAHGLVLVPRLRHHHHHGVRAARGRPAPAARARCRAWPSRCPSGR